MLHRDFLTQSIEEFCTTFTVAYERLVLGEETGAQAIEDALCKFIQLKSALSLAPASLVTMMQLSGIGDRQAQYVSYALLCLAEAYKKRNTTELANLRENQALAVARAFSCDASQKPEGL